MLLERGTLHSTKAAATRQTVLRQTMQAITTIIQTALTLPAATLILTLGTALLVMFRLVVVNLQTVMLQQTPQAAMEATATL